MHTACLCTSGNNGKAIPAAGHGHPRSWEMMIPHCRGCQPFVARKIAGTHFCYRLSRALGHSAEQWQTWDVTGLRLSRAQGHSAEQYPILHSGLASSAAWLRNSNRPIRLDWEYLEQHIHVPIFLTWCLIELSSNFTYTLQRATSSLIHQGGWEGWVMQNAREWREPTKH
jgi:hypothetical protein